MKLRPFLLLGALCAFAGSAFAQQTIFSDNFSDGNRDGWFSSGISSTLTVSNGYMTQATGTSGRSVVTNFNATSLAVGETLSLTFNLRIDGPALGNFSANTGVNNQLRFGLYYSNGVTPVAADNFNSPYSFSAYDGYGSFTSLMAGSTNSNGTPAGWTIRDRTGTENALISTTTGYTSLGATELPETSFAIDTLYEGSMSILRTEAGVEITATFFGGALGTGYTMTRLDDTNSVTTFDTIAFHLNSSVGASYSISNVEVSLIAAPIPEPSTYAALAGLLALGLVARKRFLNS